MLRRLIKNKKAQNTAEYAILISLVVAGIIAIQTYAQRALQARVKDASTLLTSQGSDPATTAGTFRLLQTRQYEPYYLNSSYTVGSNEEQSETQTNDVIGGVRTAMNSQSTKGGNEFQTFNRFITDQD